MIGRIGNNYRDHVSRLQQVASVQGAKTLTEQKTIQKKWGVRYSELQRLFNIVRYHCVDVMHNLLLGTAKDMMDTWKSIGLLSADQMDLIQETVNKV